MRTQQVTPEQQEKIKSLLKKFERKEPKSLSGSAKDLQYAVKLLEHYQNIEETGGHLVKLFQPGPLSIEHYPRHKAFFDATATHKEVLFRAGNRCLAEGTLVATPGGPVEIQNLKVGDSVYDRYGQPTKVTAVWDNGEAETVDMVHRHGVYATVTPNHEFDAIFTRDGRYDEARVQAKDLKHKVVARRIHVKAPLGPVHEPHAYVIGAFLGDGCCTVSTNTRLYFSSEDDQIPKRIAEILGAEIIHSSRWSWAFTSSPFNHHDDWCKGRKSHQKIADIDVIKTWDRHSLLQFVAGLIDTDGSLECGKTNHCLRLANQSRSVIDAFSYACLALWNELPRIRVDNREKYIHGPCFVASMSNPVVLETVCDELSRHVVLKRKATLKRGVFGKRSRGGTIAIKAVPAGKRRVFDITVEHPEHFYLLANGISVSNCGKTEAGLYTATCWATGLYPDWWSGRKFEKATYGWIAGDTNDTVRTILQDKLLGTPVGTGLIPKELIEDVVVRPNSGGTADMIYVRHKPTGKVSRLKFKTYQSGPDSFYGAAPDFVLMDEEPSGKDAQLIWNQCYIRLLTTNGTLIITFTPLMGWTPLVKNFSETAEDLTPSTHD